MKFLILIAALTGANAFAGGTMIRCDGKIHVEEPGKGPFLLHDEMNVLLERRGGDVTVHKVLIVDGKNGYDFNAFYQSYGGESAFAAVLQYVAGKHTLFFFKDGELIDQVPCTIGV